VRMLPPTRCVEQQKEGIRRDEVQGSWGSTETWGTGDRLHKASYFLSSASHLDTPTSSLQQHLT
jgi:hypothetical protein